jgi:hypothetical protein
MRARLATRRGPWGVTTLQAACPRRHRGSAHVRDNPNSRAPGDAKDAAPDAPGGFRSNVQQNAKYRQGYTETCIHSTSAGPNDASARQKHAFPS